jgi:hypothetical protein
VRDHLAYFEVPSPCAKGVVRGVRAVATPGPQLHGYKADVIGGDRDGGSEGTGTEHGHGDNDGSLISGEKSLRKLNGDLFHILHLHLIKHLLVTWNSSSWPKQSNHPGRAQFVQFGLMNFPLTPTLLCRSLQ